MAFTNDAEFQDDFRNVGQDVTAGFEPAGHTTNSTEHASSENLEFAAKDLDEEDDLEDEDELEDDDDDDDDDLEDDDVEDEDDADEDEDDFEDDEDEDLDDDEEDDDEDEDLEDDDVAPITARPVQRKK